MSTQHFISVSTGKDSELTAIRAIRRFEQRPANSNFPPRFLSCDTGNEDEGYLDFVDYMSRALGVQIEVLRADFSGEFATRRANIEIEWSKEKRIRRHSAECKARQGVIPTRERMGLCKCPENVLPALPPQVIADAKALLETTGNPFLDLCMLKGRFPGMKSRFCTDELKIKPMMAIKQPLLDAGVNVVEWIGERAEESPGRARKPVIQRIRHPNGATQILYRPIHALKRAEVFAGIADAGLRHNPLYDLGAKRVGCWLCIACGKDEVQLFAKHTPHEVARLREWERIVGLVSRKRMATFFAAKMIPGQGDGRAHIDAVIEWSATTRGGKQFDIFRSRQLADANKLGLHCDRELAVCE